jgi:uncharacterized membrane-anchored protein
VSRRTRTAFLALAGLQVLLPLGIVGWNELALATGTEVRLATVPVDPVDLFRGRYVTLRYEISRATLHEPVDTGETVYVPLRRVGETWIASGPATTSRPDSDTFIRGRARHGNDRPTEIEVEYGIETYYADEDEAQELERHAGSLLVDVVIDDDGKARVEEIAGRR